MNINRIIGIAIVILLIVLAIKVISHEDNPGENVRDSIENVGDNIEEAANDAGRNLEDATD